MKKRGVFITFEGTEGCGKTTHVTALAGYLQKNGLPFIRTREPGGTATAEEIRNILLDPAHPITPAAELLLYEASRAQHTEELIIPALAEGKIVLCDRYTDATLAYQGYARNLNKTEIIKLNRIAARGLVPDLTILLDHPVEHGLAKARALAKAKEAHAAGDRIEREDLSFHYKVRKGYLAIARTNPRRVKLVKVHPTIEATQQEIIVLVEHLLKRKRFTTR